MDVPLDLLRKRTSERSGLASNADVSYPCQLQRWILNSRRQFARTAPSELILITLTLVTWATPITSPVTLLHTPSAPWGSWGDQQLLFLCTDVGVGMVEMSAHHRAAR